MKKIRRMLAVLVMVLIAADCSVAYASETGVNVIASEMTVRELSQSELSVLEDMEGEDTSSISTRASYTAYEYSRTFDFTLEGTWVAQADAKCIVYHYTDGKVHLYRRTITVTRLATIDAERTYGRIVNTDGSLSYTEGDRVTLIDYGAYWDYALDFRVTPTEASFNCYEV